MRQGGQGWIEQAHRQAAEQNLERQEPPTPSSEHASIHYTELQELPADSPVREEWKTYRRELPRLLKERQEGKFALVKGGEVVGIFATLDEGVQAGRQKYLMQPFLVQPIREREPLLRTRGHSSPCHSSGIPSPKMSELTTAIPDIDLLIGMDVLLDCKLLLDGPARNFTLEF